MVFRRVRTTPSDFKSTDMRAGAAPQGCSARCALPRFCVKITHFHALFELVRAGAAQGAHRAARCCAEVSFKVKSFIVILIVTIILWKKWVLLTAQRQTKTKQTGKILRPPRDGSRFNSLLRQHSASKKDSANRFEMRQVVLKRCRDFPLLVMALPGPSGCRCILCTLVVCEQTGPRFRELLILSKCNGS